jgi:hypothetical protein
MQGNVSQEPFAKPERLRRRKAPENRHAVVTTVLLGKFHEETAKDPGPFQASTIVPIHHAVNRLGEDERRPIHCDPYRNAGVLSNDLSGIGDRKANLGPLWVIVELPPPMGQGAFFTKDAVEKPDDLILIPWPV